jgi:hypothetical protein
LYGGVPAIAEREPVGGHFSMRARTTEEER